MVNGRWAPGDVRTGWLRFGRREFSGAFGDIGTDLPLVAGMIIAAGLDPMLTFLVFGLLQIGSALIYGIPMPVQPLKVVAAVVIAQGLEADIIRGAALGVALIMGVLTLTRAIDGLARSIPTTVIRGIQVGLGVKLGVLAIGRYVPAEGQAGLYLAAASALLLAWLMRRTRVPAAVVVLGAGAVWAVWRGADPSGGAADAVAAGGWGWPGWDAVWTGFVLLALPQVPLSIGNSVLATGQLAADWFPDRDVTPRRIGTTYSLFNAVVGVIGGIPVCHGSGGMAGHYAFGARTGGSVIYYGVFYLVLAAAVALGLPDIAVLLPLPVLGVILAVEAGALIGRARTVDLRTPDMALVVFVAAVANLAPYGFLTALAAGTLLARSRRAPNRNNQRDDVRRLQRGVKWTDGN